MLTALRSLALLPLLIVIPLATQPAQALSKTKKDDVVRLLDGGEELGVIQSEDYDGLRIKDGTLIPWDRVHSVEYSDQPAFNEAMASLRAGNLNGAIEQLDAVAKDTKRKIVKQAAVYQKARALQGLGRFDDALAAYDEMLKTFPKSRYLFEAGEGVLESALAKGDPAAAVQIVESYCSEASRNLDGGFRAESGLLRGRALMEQGRLDEAREAFEDARSAKDVAESVNRRGDLGVAQCLQASGKRSDAETLYKQLTTAQAPSFVLAGAWNGLGDFTKEEAKGKKDRDRMVDALYQYLRGVVQYTPLPGTSTIEHERALAGAAECFKFMAELSTDQNQKIYYLTAARARYDHLANDYPNSPLLKDFSRP